MNKINTQDCFGTLGRLLTDGLPRQSVVLTILVGISVNGLHRGFVAAQNGIPPIQIIQSVDGQAILRNEELRAWRNSALRYFRADRPESALRQIQKIFDSQEDSFEPNSEGAGFVGVRDSISRLLSSAPVEIRNLYELIHGAEALSMLREAEEQGDIQGLEEVYRRWFHTQAGYEAARKIAAWHFDHGNPEFSLAIWNRLVADPQHSSKFTVSDRAQQLAALKQSDRSGELSASWQHAATAENVRLGGEDLNLNSWLGTISLPWTKESLEWNMPLGSACRDSRRMGSPPATHALYSRPLLNSMREERPLNHRLQEIRRRNSAIGGGMMPLIVRNQLIYRDASAVRGMNLETGRELWSYPVQFSLSHVLTSENDRQGDLEEVELDRFGLANSLAFGMSADSNHVYVIEGPFVESERDGGDDGKRRRTPLYQLTALPLDDLHSATTKTVPPSWKTGDHMSPIVDSMTFLGPPTPAHGKLYAMAESDLILYLLELNSEKGTLLAKMPLAVLQHPLAGDRSRQHLSLIPTISDGIAVCPTSNGFLVAVDLTTGSLRWVHYQLNTMDPRGLVPANRRQTHIYESEGFLTTPMIHRGLVFDAPRFSQSLTCLDLETGKVRWQVDRREALYIASALEDTLIIVNRQGCRALHTGTGEQKWETKVGTPGGRGILTGERFLLPLSDGKVVSIDVHSGRQFGYPAPIDTATGAGHLIASGEMIVSTTPTEVSVFRQSHAELHQLLTESTQALDPIERQIRIGELQLRTGNLVSAEEAISKSLALPGVTSEQRNTAEQLLRELLYIELRSQTVPPTHLLATLDGLSRTPGDRITYLAHLAEYQMSQADWVSAEKTIVTLLSHSGNVPLTMSGEPRLQVMSRAWGAGVLARLSAINPPVSRVDTAAPFPDQETTDLGSLWRNEIAHYSRMENFALIRESLSRRLTEEDRYQEAESLLLINRDSKDRVVAAEARKRLIELWDRRGLYEEAADLLHELGHRYAETHLRDGTTGREYYREFPNDRLTSAYARRLIPPREPVVGIRFQLQAPRTNNSRSGVSVGNRLLSRMRGSQYFVERNVSGSYLVDLVDRESGQVLENFELREQYFSTRSREMNPSLIPLWGPNSAAALSVLDRKVMWNDLVWQDSAVNGLLRAGPSGADFVTYQVDQSLIVADPMTGVIRWKRDDLDARDGMAGDPLNGIIGDSECLVVFNSATGGYRIFDTLDGKELRAGNLSASRSYFRVANGRILLYGEEGSDQHLRIKIWDPLSDKTLYVDRVLHRLSQQFPLFDSGRQLAYVDAEGFLKVIETETGIVRLKVSFPGDDSTSAINVFEDTERYFINIQRSVPPGEAARGWSEARDLMIPWTPIQGEVHAFDRKSGVELWRREFSPCSVIQVPQYRLPFLMCVSRRHRVLNRAQGMTMSFEAIDAATGISLCVKADLPSDSLHQLSYEPQDRKLYLLGNQSTWEMDFDNAVLPKILENDGMAGISEHPKTRLNMPENRQF